MKSVSQALKARSTSGARPSIHTVCHCVDILLCLHRPWHYTENYNEYIEGDPTRSIVVIWVNIFKTEKNYRNTSSQAN